MEQFTDFTFNLSVSTRCFTGKEQAKASCATIKFAPREMDQDTFLHLAGSGYAFTYNFKNNRRKPELFLNTPVVIYDIDHCEKEMTDYIAGLPFKPSLGYTTYSNGKDGKFSYRLVYCFNSLIRDEATFNTLYVRIAAANGFGEEFDKRRLNQLYFGSNRDEDGFGEYVSHLVYSLDDFGLSTEGGFFPREFSITSTSPHNNLYEKDYTLPEPDTDAYYNNYVRSLATPLFPSTSGTHYYYPEEYYAVPIRIVTWNGKKVVKRWKDGEQRRKKLYISALIMLRNVPDLTPDNLRFNLWLLMREYYDNNCDDRITPRDIDGIVERAMANKDTHHLDPTFHKSFKLNKEYWQGEVDNVLDAVKAVVKERNLARMAYFDRSISVAANHKAMKEMGFKISPSTLYRYINELGMKRDLDSEILELMQQEPTISIRELASVLHKSSSTIRRHIKQLVEQSRIVQEMKPWIVMDEEKA